MDRKSIIRFIDDMFVNIPLTQTEMDELYGIKQRKHIGFTQVRLVYHTAINHQMYPVCPYCKNQITNLETFTIDHNIPKSKGGSGRIENLQPMHRECNLKKGSEMPENTENSEWPVKKHRKKHNNKKQRESIRCHSAEEMYQRCAQIAQTNARRYHGNSK